MKFMNVKPNDDTFSKPEILINSPSKSHISNIFKRKPNEKDFSVHDIDLGNLNEQEATFVADYISK